MRRALKGLELREWVEEENEGEEEDQTSTPLSDDVPTLVENAEDDADADEEEDDPLILESGRILADFITLNQRRISAISDIPT